MHSAAVVEQARVSRQDIIMTQSSTRTEIKLREQRGHGAFELTCFQQKARLKTEQIILSPV